MNLFRHHILITILLLLFSTGVAFAGVTDNEMHFRMKAADESLDPDTRLAFIDSLISVSPEDTDSLLLLSSNLAYMTGRYRVAQESAKKLLDKDIQRGCNLDVSRRCEAMFNRTKAGFKLNDFADAIEYAYALINLPKPDSLLYYDIDCINILYDFNSSLSCHGGTIGMDGNIDSFIQKAQKILADAEKKGASKPTLDKMKKSILFSKMTHAADTKDYQGALRYGAEMMRYPLTDIEKLALQGNMSMIYLYLEDYKMAESYYSQILSEPGWHNNHAICLQNYMYTLRKLDMPQEAIDAMDSHPEIIAMVRNELEYVSLLHHRSNALYDLDKDQEAYVTLWNSVLMGDSINSSINSGYVSKLINSFETITQLNEANHKFSARLKWSCIALAVCLAAIGVLAWRLAKLKKRENDNMAESQSIANPKTNETPEESRESKDIGQLTVRALQLASLNEAFSDIAGIVADATTSDKDKVEKIRSQMKEISSFNDIWETFLLLFENLHPKFFSDLKEAYPDLTLGETRMCAYVMLNMTNKEIAAMTRRSTRSVETMRYRLTKKMNLPEGTTLASRLHTLSTR